MARCVNGFDTPNRLPKVPAIARGTTTLWFIKFCQINIICHLFIPKCRGKTEWDREREGGGKRKKATDINGSLTKCRCGYEDDGVVDRERRHIFFFKLTTITIWQMTKLKPWLSHRKIHCWNGDAMLGRHDDCTIGFSATFSRVDGAFFSLLLLLSNLVDLVYNRLRLLTIWSIRFDEN